jgi:hypothetical protein
MNNLFKYPRTYHLPWSEGLQSDDKKTPSLGAFYDLDIVVTKKMDGENTSLYRNHYHARSLDSKHHPSRDWIKSFHGAIKRNIPENWRICGENMYATHSIHYSNLESYFLGFSIWNEENICLSWPDTLEWFGLLDITPVEEIWQGKFEDFLKIHNQFDSTLGENLEGYVVRNLNAFHYDDFSTNVAKVVRKNHVQTDEHWMHKAIVPNKLKES